MGDRANVYVKNNISSGVWLYTHWGGTELPETLQEALASDIGRRRWGDSAYLTRIIFNKMQDDDRGETGFGISTTMPDNEHDILVVDCKERKVFLGEEYDRHTPRISSIGWRFEEFVDIPNISWKKLGGR